MLFDLQINGAFQSGTFSSLTRPVVNALLCPTVTCPAKRGIDRPFHISFQCVMYSHKGYRFTFCPWWSRTLSHWLRAACLQLSFKWPLLYYVCRKMGLYFVFSVAAFVRCFHHLSHCLHNGRGTVLASHGMPFYRDSTSTSGKMTRISNIFASLYDCHRFLECKLISCWTYYHPIFLPLNWQELPVISCRSSNLFQGAILTYWLQINRT